MRLPRHCARCESRRRLTAFARRWANSAMKTRELQIAVAHDDVRTLSTLNALLAELGHRMCASATSGRQFVERCLVQQPDLLIVKAQLPDMDAGQAGAQASQGRPIPIILLVNPRHGQFVERRDAQNLFAVITEPVRLGDLNPAIPLVMRRFHELSELREEHKRLRKVLADS